MKKVILLCSVALGVMGFTKMETAKTVEARSLSQGDRSSKTIGCENSGNDCTRLSTVIITPSEISI